MSAADFDVTVVGHGLSGLVATHQLVPAGKRVLIVDRDNRNNLGGQAFWSLSLQLRAGEQVNAVD